MQNVYMDYTATTPVSPEVLKAMTPYFTEMFGNPSSVYSFSRKSREAIEKARGQVAAALNAEQEKRCRNGAEFVAKLDDGTWRLYGENGEFLALAAANGGRVKTIKSFF